MTIHKEILSMKSSCCSTQHFRPTIFEYNNHNDDDKNHNGHKHRNQRFLLSGIVSGILSSIGIEEPKDPDADDPLKMTIKRAILLMNKGEHDSAEAIFHAALKIATDLSNEKAVDYIYIMMAENAMDQRDLDKAEKLYRESMRRLLSSGRCQENDEEIVEISLHLATIYGERGEKLL
jgi:tetratricopeptide (TPR) repeat protein